MLYPAPLRDLLMHLALSDLFRAKWTEAIHDEWMRNVLINRSDLSREQLERTRDLMNKHGGDCLVKDYEDLISVLSLPDPNDRHVLAASICASASVIVTYNLKDFPPKNIKQYGVEAQHPDDFILHLLDLSPLVVCATIKRLREGLRNPPLDAQSYLKILERLLLTRTVIKLNEFFDLL